MKRHTAKRKGVGLEVKTFTGKSGGSYVVFQSTGGSYHVLVEIEAKKAAKDCGAKGGNTREMWKSLWGTV